MNTLESIITFFKDIKSLKPIIITFILSASATYVVLDKTIIEGNSSTIESLRKDREYLSSQYKYIQTLLDKQMTGEESRLNKKTEDIRHFYDLKTSELEQNYKNLMQERDMLASQLDKYRYNAKLSLENSNNEKISELRNNMNNIDRSISFLHSNRAKLNSEYGYMQKECEKREHDFYSNICQQTSKIKAQMDSLMEQITSLEKRRDSLQEEINSLQRKTIN